MVRAIFEYVVLQGACAYGVCVPVRAVSCGCGVVCGGQITHATPSAGHVHRPHRDDEAVRQKLEEDEGVLCGDVAVWLCQEHCAN